MSAKKFKNLEPGKQAVLFVEHIVRMIQSPEFDAKTTEIEKREWVVGQVQLWCDRLGLTREVSAWVYTAIDSDQRDLRSKHIFTYQLLKHFTELKEEHEIMKKEL